MSIEKFLKLFFNSLFEKKYNTEITLKNSPLVCIKVKQKIDHKRYILLVNEREITCISHKSLEISQNYWCIISVDKDGIITLSQLQKQPDFFQNNSFFSFELPFNEIVKNIKAKDLKSYYLHIVNSQKLLDKEQIKSILFCLQNGILSYPLFLYNEPMFLQFKAINQNLIEKNVEYYFAFKNFGCFSGVINSDKNILRLKYDNVVEIERYKDIVLIKKDTIEPLCKISKNILDLKG